MSPLPGPAMNAQEQSPFSKEAVVSPASQRSRQLQQHGEGISLAWRTALGIVLSLGVAAVLWADALQLENRLPEAMRALPGVQELLQDGLLMALVAALVVGMAAHEYSLLSRRLGAEFSPTLFVAASVTLLLLLWAGWAAMLGHFTLCPAWLRQPGLTALVGLCAAAFPLLAGRVLGARPEGSIQTVSLFTLGLLYVPVAFGFIGALRARWGVPAVVMAVAVCKSTDVGAYYAGRFIKGPRLGLQLSPRKTWAGAVGGTAAAVLMALALSAAGWTMDWLSPVQAVVFALMLGPVAVLGDLSESLLKRQAGVKDSGCLVPGFGGMLDLVDDLLFALPFSYVWFAAVYYYS